MPTIAKTSNSKALFLRIRNPERIIFEGEILALSSVNLEGPFDVLEAHGNFISIIKDKVVIYFRNGKNQIIPLENGVLKVLGDKVNIFLGLEKLKK